MKKIKLPDRPLTDGKVLRSSISYMLGGPNYFHGTQFPRGYYLTTMIVEVVRESQDVRVERMILGRGHKKLLAEAKRFSQKKLEQLARELDPATRDAVEAATLAQAGLTQHTPS